jgi:ubiquinol-cytochrome c reductase subunit 8
MKQKGVYQYSTSLFSRCPKLSTQRLNVLPAISPFQAKAAPNMLRNYLFNAYRRLSKEFLFFSIPFATGERFPLTTVSIINLDEGYGIYAWAKKTDRYQNSKAGHIAAGAHGH